MWVGRPFSGKNWRTNFLPPKCVLTPKNHFERHFYFPLFRGGRKKSTKAEKIYMILVCKRIYVPCSNFLSAPFFRFVLDLLRIGWDFLDTSICLTFCIFILYLSVSVDLWHSTIFYLLRNYFLHSFFECINTKRAKINFKKLLCWFLPIFNQCVGMISSKLI